MEPKESITPSDRHSGHEMWQYQYDCSTRQIYQPDHIELPRHGWFHPSSGSSSCRRPAVLSPQLLVASPPYAPPACPLTQASWSPLPFGLVNILGGVASYEGCAPIMARSAHGVIGQLISQAGTPPARSPTLPGHLFLSDLLNIPNGVASQVRCVLTMTLKAFNVKVPAQWVTQLPSLNFNALTHSR